MSARDRILARLHRAAPAQVPAPPAVAPWYAGHRPCETPAEKLQRFRHFIELAHAEVHPVSAETWPQTLAGLLQSRGLGELLLGSGTPHGRLAAPALAAAGIRLRDYAAPIESWKAELFHSVPASLTAARAGIAETGTLILWPDAAEPRLMSLVPPLHIALLDARRLYNTFHEAIQAENWAGGLPTNALLISGPSKTADIQQTLAYGAHGPKELIVLLLTEDAA